MTGCKANACLYFKALMTDSRQHFQSFDHDMSNHHSFLRVLTMVTITDDSVIAILGRHKAVYYWMIGFATV